MDHRSNVPLFSTFLFVVVVSLIAQQSGACQELASQSKGLPSAEKIIDRYIHLIGGYEVIQSVSSFHYEMSVVSLAEVGLTYKYEAYAKESLCFEEYVGSDGRISSRGVNGGVGWDRTNGQLREFSEAEVASFTRLFPSRNEMPNWIKTCKEVQCEGRKKVRGKDAFHVHMVLKDDLTSDKYFDVDSGLLVRTVDKTIYNGAPLEVICEIFQFEQFGDQLLRKKQRITFGNKSYNFVMEACEFNIDVPDEIFDLPPSIQQRLAIKKHKDVECK